MATEWKGYCVPVLAFPAYAVVVTYLVDPHPIMTHEYDQMVYFHARENNSTMRWAYRWGGVEKVSVYKSVAFRVDAHSMVTYKRNKMVQFRA